MEVIVTMRIMVLMAMIVSLMTLLSLEIWET